uniref:Uncharacterized protein n=1 Tax=viral metagenome TaxID=1070528 RepID=A0A6M3LW01_9ZZZZ
MNEKLNTEIQKLTEIISKDVNDYTQKFNRMFALSQQRDVTSLEYKKLEMQITEAILNAKVTDNDGKEKPRYSNQQQRDIAISKGMDTNNLTKEIKDKQKELDYEINDLKKDLDILKFKQRGIRMMVDLISNKEVF